MIYIRQWQLQHHNHPGIQLPKTHNSLNGYSSIQAVRTKKESFIIPVTSQDKETNRVLCIPEWDNQPTNTMNCHAFKGGGKKTTVSISVSNVSKSVYLLDLKYWSVNCMLRIRSVDRSDQMPVQKARCSITISEKWVSVAQFCPTLCDPVDCSTSGSSVHGILQARILGWVAIPFSRVSSQPISCIVGRFFTVWDVPSKLHWFCHFMLS